MQLLLGLLFSYDSKLVGFLVVRCIAIRARHAAASYSIEMGSLPFTLTV